MVRNGGWFIVVLPTLIQIEKEWLKDMQTSVLRSADTCLEAAEVLMCVLQPKSCVITS